MKYALIFFLFIIFGSNKAYGQTKLGSVKIAIKDSIEILYNISWHDTTLTTEEKRKVVKRLTELQFLLENTYTDNNEIFATYRQQNDIIEQSIQTQLENLMKIALDTFSTSEDRIRAIDSLANSKHLVAYKFLLQNLTEIVISPSWIDASADVTQYVCYYSIVKRPESFGKDWFLFPILLEEMNQEKSEKDLEFIASLFLHITALGDDFTVTFLNRIEEVGMSMFNYKPVFKKNMGVVLEWLKEH